MFQKPDSLSLDQLINHVAEHSPDGVESFVGVTDIRQSSFVEKDLLHDEYGHSLGELGSGFHDAEAERYYLCRQQKVDDGAVIVLLCSNKR
jgi:hypothetical protein